MKIVTRAQWGARPPVSVTRMPEPAQYTFLHHTADERGGTGAEWVRAEQAYHMDVNGWGDIGYSWLYDPRDKTFYEGRGWGVAGAHTYGYNSVGHALCLLGNFDTRTLDGADVQALGELLRLVRDQGHGPAVFTGHGSMPDNATACPGRYANARIPEINAAASSAPAPVPPPPAPVQAWAAVTSTDADFVAARDLLHMKLGMAIYNPADAQARRLPLVVYVGAADVPAQPWRYHRRTIQLTGNGIAETRALLDWIVKVGLP